ncbi:hypothetical protein [Leptolyngbya sp. FACHB-17]|uniref:hypothetical protein n=1 Tax=unclassified Leptolyngbya TaxID=2650499 RepID=UPI001680312D|nr:hypothetical protein [Leptolyngbya sp. FACHB-17]MBD2079693.1 hypothetical protein [Leptolyngbya sp. FACHB-17]
MGFAIDKSSQEEIDLSAIEQIKLELLLQFQQQSFSVPDLQRHYPGESRLFLLDDSIAVRAIHINLVYALLELHQQNQLRIVDRSPVRFCIEP